MAALGVGMGLVCEGKILRLRFATLRMTCGGDGFPHAREQRERDGSPHARGQRVGDGGAANHPTGEDAVRHGVHPHPPSSRGQALNLPPSRGKGFVGAQQAIFIIIALGGAQDEGWVLRARLHGGRLFAGTTGEGWGWIPACAGTTGEGWVPACARTTGGGWVGTGGSRTAPTGTGR